MCSQSNLLENISIKGDYGPYLRNIVSVGFRPQQMSTECMQRYATVAILIKRQRESAMDSLGSMQEHCGLFELTPKDCKIDG